MTVKRVAWSLGEPLPPPGTIVGDISLHAPGVKFGVVLAPEPSDRVRRITSSDPAVWKPAIAETCEAVWPARIVTKHAEETERYQQEIWGATGLDILAIADDLEIAREEAYWAAHAQHADDELDALDMPISN